MIIGLDQLHYMGQRISEAHNACLSYSISVRKAANPDVNTSSDGESTTFLDLLFQLLITLVQDLHLTSSLNLPSISFQALDLVLSYSARLRALCFQKNSSHVGTYCSRSNHLLAFS